jgi:Tol biopolymer transport system component
VVGRVLVVGATVVALITGFLPPTPPVRGAYPGRNGLIVLERVINGYSQLFLMQKDGDLIRRLTHTPREQNITPEWSPSGRRIAFASTRADTGYYDLYVMDPGGEHVRRITRHPAFDAWPSWSPGGARLAFHSSRDGFTNIYTINLRTRRVLKLTSDGGTSANPLWSPAGDRIAFTSDRFPNEEAPWTFDIWSMEPDGTDKRRLTDTPVSEHVCDWSPDGQRILFVRVDEENRQFDLYSMAADGSDERKILDGASWTTAYSPSGRRLLASYDGLRIYRLDGTPVRLLSERGAEHLDWQPRV